MPQTDVLAENSQKGWIALPESAPAWVKNHVKEFRAAVLEQRSMRASYLASFAREAEVRSAAAATFERGVFRPSAAVLPTTRPAKKVESLEEQAKRQALQIRSDEFRDAKNFKVVRDARGNVTSIEIDHAEEARRKQFGDGGMSADEVLYFKRQFALRTGLDF